MTYSYFISNIGVVGQPRNQTRTPTATDLVRMRVGDVRARDYLLEDEEIAQILTLVSQDVAQASLRSARLMLSRVIQDVDTNGSGINLVRKQKIDNIKELITQLESEVLGATQLTLTGNSKAEEETRAQDDDKKGPYFQVGMDRNRGANAAAAVPPTEPVR